MWVISRFRRVIPVIFVLVVVSCGGGGDSNPATPVGDQRGDLISATLSNSYTQQGLAILAALQSFPELVLLVLVTLFLI